MEIYHAGEQIGPRSTHGLELGQQHLVDMQDGEGITMQCPHPHHHHETNQVYQSAHVEGQKLVDRMCYLQVRDLYGRKMAM